MKVGPTSLVSWSEVTADIQPGASGKAEARTRSAGSLRLRRMTLSPAYAADHWCELGHIVLVLSGKVTIEMRDGRRYHIGPGDTFVVSSGSAEEHQLRSERGAELFVVDEMVQLKAIER